MARELHFANYLFFRFDIRLCAHLFAPFLFLSNLYTSCVTRSPHFFLYSILDSSRLEPLPRNIPDMRISTPPCPSQPEISNHISQRHPQIVYRSQYQIVLATIVLSSLPLIPSTHIRTPTLLASLAVTPRSSHVFIGLPQFWTIP